MREINPWILQQNTDFPVRGAIPMFQTLQCEIIGTFVASMSYLVTQRSTESRWMPMEFCRPPCVRFWRAGLPRSLSLKCFIPCLYVCSTLVTTFVF